MGLTVCGLGCRFGTAKFLGLFGLQLMLWLIYAVVLVADATVLVTKALRDLEDAPEIWVRRRALRGRVPCLLVSLYCVSGVPDAIAYFNCVNLSCRCDCFSRMRFACRLTIIHRPEPLTRN